MSSTTNTAGDTSSWKETKEYDEDLRIALYMLYQLTSYSNMTEERIKRILKLVESSLLTVTKISEDIK